MTTNFSLSDISERNGEHRTEWAEAFVRSKAPDYEVQLGEIEDRVVKEFGATKTCMKTNDPVDSLTSKGQSSEVKLRRRFGRTTYLEDR